MNIKRFINFKWVRFQFKFYFCLSLVWLKGNRDKVHFSDGFSKLELPTRSHMVAKMNAPFPRAHTMTKVKIILEVIRLVISLPHQRITFRYYFPVCQFCSLYWPCQFNGWYCQRKIWHKANDADFSWFTTHAVYLINRTIITRYNSFVRI